MPSLGWQELVIVLVIVIIIFGAGRLPEIGGALGKSIKEFKANSDTDIPAGQVKATTATSERIVDDAKVEAKREVRPDEI